MAYLPRSESDLVTWGNNFIAKLNTHAGTVGVSKQDLSAAQADVAYLSYLLHELLPLYRAKAQEITAYKDLIKDGPIGAPGGTLPVAPSPPKAPAGVQPGVLPRVQALVQRIKNASGYTPAIGADLGIEGPPADSSVADSERPQFKAVALPGSQVRLEWTKGKSSGVRVESKRATETDWSRLDDDRYSPYLDERPPVEVGKSETRSYRLRYLKKDELVGDYSDTVTLQTLP